MSCSVRRFLLVLVVVGLLPIASVGVSGNQGPATPQAIGGSPTASSIQVAWTQIGDDGALQARVVVQGNCPVLIADGMAVAMSVRAEQSDAFPVTVCEAGVSSGVQDLQVGERVLPVLAEEPQRIVAIGDTGCRIAESWHQLCNDPGAWPFAGVAAQAASWRPDLVIHTGDYLYREFACPTDAEDCAGSPFGDTWEAWRVDLFEPAAPLLSASPWLFVRGNHESCARNGEGWFRLLDPGPYTGECLDLTDPWLVNFGDQSAIVFDAAAARDADEDPVLAAAYAQQFELVASLAGSSPAWLISHKAFTSLGAGEDGEPVRWTTATFVEAGFSQPPAMIDLVIAGHVHMAEMLQFATESGKPVTLIVGNAGTALDQFGGTKLSGADIGDETLVTGIRYALHGFTSLEQTDAGWVASVHAVDESVAMSCLIDRKQTACLLFTDPET